MLLAVLPVGSVHFVKWPVGAGCVSVETRAQPGCIASITRTVHSKRNRNDTNKTHEKTHTLEFSTEKEKKEKKKTKKRKKEAV